MRAFAYFAFSLLLCGYSIEQDKVAAAAPKTAAKTMVTANGSKPGIYSVKHADGTVTRTILNANGTYRDLAANGKVSAAGKWTVTNGKTCFAPTTKGATGMCFKETAPARDGSFTATPDKGKPVTVSPMRAR